MSAVITESEDCILSRNKHLAVYVCISTHILRSYINL